MIAYRIVAVPERLVHARELAVRVGGSVILDQNHDGAFPNHQRALASVRDASHVVVLEDDAIVCPDFLAHVERLVEERPDHLIGLYVGREHPRQVQKVLGESVCPGWLDIPKVVERLRWAVGYVMPTVDIPAVLDHLAVGSQHPWLNTDVRIGGWHSARGRLSYPFPSPVDHDDTIPSMTSRGKLGRVAWRHCSVPQ